MFGLCAFHGLVFLIYETIWYLVFHNNNIINSNHKPVFCFVRAERKVTQFYLTFLQQINFPYNHCIWSNECCFDLSFSLVATPIIKFTRVILISRLYFCIQIKFSNFHKFSSFSPFLFITAISLDKLFEIFVLCDEIIGMNMCVFVAILI